MNYKFSGHETFPCRYAWLPKAYRALCKMPTVFSDEERAMVKLGVGKNMVRAIRFWAQACGVARPGPNGGYVATEFGHALLSDSKGDPFLEDRRTLWLLHWNLSTHVDEPLFAWDYLMNSWTQPEITRTEVLKVFTREARHLGRKLSSVTIEQHFDVFLHTYIPTRSKKGDIQEDNLDCPLVELDLIRCMGERRSETLGRREPIYGFSRDLKPDVTPELFLYCIGDFWSRRRPSEQTLTFRDVAVSHGSPGQVFKLSEADVRERLEAVAENSGGVLQYQESAAVQRVIRKKTLSQVELLRNIYLAEGVYA